MARINGIYLALALICLLVAVESTRHRISCKDAKPATINGPLILGTWYEAARKPIGGGENAEQCVQMIFDYDNGKVSTEITYSINPKALWINQTVVNLVMDTSASGSNQEIFPGVFVVTSDVSSTYKILETDYDSYAFICGYVEDSAHGTVSGAVIITRERQISFSTLAQLTVNALNKYSDFDDISLVTQTSQCY